MAGGGVKSFEPSALPWIPCRQGGSGVQARVTAWVNTQEPVEDHAAGREAGGSHKGELEWVTLPDQQALR